MVISDLPDKNESASLVAPRTGGTVVVARTTAVLMTSSPPNTDSIVWLSHVYKHLPVLSQKAKKSVWACDEEVQGHDAPPTPIQG